MDLSQLTTVLSGLAGSAALIIVALGRRRETRDRQFDDMQRSRDELQRLLNEMRRDYRELQHRHDAMLGWVWEARRTMREGGVEPPELPRELR